MQQARGKEGAGYDIRAPRVPPRWQRQRSCATPPKSLVAASHHATGHGLVVKNPPAKAAIWTAARPSLPAPPAPARHATTCATARHPAQALRNDHRLRRWPPAPRLASSAQGATLPQPTWPSAPVARPRRWQRCKEPPRSRAACHPARRRRAPGWRAARPPQPEAIKATKSTRGEARSPTGPPMRGQHAIHGAKPPRLS